MLSFGLVHRLFLGVTKAVMNCFHAAAKPSASHQAASTTLQHYALAFFSHILDSVPAALPVLQSLGYLDLLFGPAFFFFGCQQAQPQSRPPIEVLASSMERLGRGQCPEQLVTLDLKVDERLLGVAVVITTGGRPEQERNDGGKTLRSEIVLLLSLLGAVCLPQMPASQRGLRQALELQKI